jgi:hypothetical protein
MMDGAWSDRKERRQLNVAEENSVLKKALGETARASEISCDRSVDPVLSRGDRQLKMVTNCPDSRGRATRLPHGA